MADPEQDGIAKLAQGHGVKLRLNSEVIRARKPDG
jgi:L-2-hydroxyglutarate oxidase LhgO